ncbi:YfaZ precursor [Serratia fonticola]|uniref:YfaZ n=1 Tax=Serratia fonticola TaxID=47917 RepID=A0A4U9VPH3_SERFO|nr:YfaZ precursor [Serratia fonticola]
MNKTLVACAAGLLFVAGSANAISVSGEAGEHYTNLGVGLGGTTAGLGISGNWIRSDHDGDIGSLGLSFGLPVGPLTATVGGKAIYLSPERWQRWWGIGIRRRSAMGPQPLSQPVWRRLFCAGVFDQRGKSLQRS